MTFRSRWLCRTVQGKGSFVLGVNPGLVHEQRVVEIQKDLEKVLDKAKSYDLSKDEIRDLFDILRRNNSMRFVKT